MPKISTITKIGKVRNPAANIVNLDELKDVADITEAQGQIIYHDGVNWNALEPGVSGQFLKTQGAGANPTWADIPVPTEPTKELWVTNFALGANATRRGLYYHPAVELPDAVTAAVVYFGFRVPHDFTSLLAGYPKILLYSTASGNVVIGMTARAAASGEALFARSDSIASFVQAIVEHQLLELDISAAFDGLALAAGDQVGVYFYRDSDHVNDTLIADLYVLGISVRYS